MGGSRPRLTVSPPERLFDALLVVALSADAEGRLEPCVVSRYPPDVRRHAQTPEMYDGEGQGRGRPPIAWEQTLLGDVF